MHLKYNMQRYLLQLQAIHMRYYPLIYLPLYLDRFRIANISYIQKTNNLPKDNYVNKKMDLDFIFPKRSGNFHTLNPFNIFRIEHLFRAT